MAERGQTVLDVADGGAFVAEAVETHRVTLSRPAGAVLRLGVFQRSGRVADSQVMTGPGREVLLTREVRWFFDGSLPADVESWFTAGSTRSVRKSRSDVYDLAPARRGIGVKHRDGTRLDAKRKIAELGVVRLRPGVEGRVDDWEKTAQSGLTVGPERLVVSKEIITLRFAAESPPDRGPAGCEVELASISVGSARSWSLCFETFGDPVLRGEALEAGLEGLLGEGPLPEGLELRSERSCGYPEWLTTQNPVS